MIDRDAESGASSPPLAEPSGGAESPVSDDRVEVWARRIGRALGYVVLALLAVNLLTHWFF